MDNIQILQECYSRVTLIPVVGSGLSIPMGLPSWRELIEKSADYFSISDEKKECICKCLDRNEYLDATDVILKAGVSDQMLREYIAKSMTEAKENSNSVDNNYLDLALFSKIRYMTTNYDQYINDFAEAKTFCLEDLENMQINQFAYSAYDHVVIPLHGEISRPESIVLSRDSYQKLYNTDSFKFEFEHMRTHFTFLFMGFSFEDKYIQKLFDKILHHYQAQHFILFDKSEADKNTEKIERIKTQYGIETVFYDASKKGHIEGIRDCLQDIFKLRDIDVNSASVKVLPVNKKFDMQLFEKKIIEKGKQLINSEQATKLYNLYYAEYEKQDFASKSVAFKINIVCGLLWYYGVLRKDAEAVKLLDSVYEDKEIYANRNKISFMQGQLYCNLREFDKGIEILENNGRNGILSELLLDIIKVYKQFLPDANHISGQIPVYTKSPRSDEENKRYREAYLGLKKKYINPDTYNLLNLKDYEDRESESVAYYWLGLASGQLFHEHKEAIEYLLRASELDDLMVIHEELANNYFELARTELRYEKNPKKYQIDVECLFKAKIHFQYIMNFSDEEVVHSFVEKSGFAYLQTLYWLKEYITFYDFYNKYEKYLPDKDYIWMLKAETDAEYHHIVGNDLLKKLNPKDRSYIEYRCVYGRIELFHHINPAEYVRLCNALIIHAQKDYPIEDRRIFQMILDVAITGKNVQSYEDLRKQYPQEYFQDAENMGFVDELYGNMEAAYKKFSKMFEEHKDYDGSFRIMKGFLIRNKKRKEYNHLYDQLMADPPDISYEQPQFYADRVREELLDWNDKFKAMELYTFYYDQIKGDMTLAKELEEAIKINIADYSGYEERIAWNRYMLTKAPQYAKIQIYDTILKLYVANMKYKEAVAVVEEMQQLKIPFMSRFNQCTMVCARPQRSSFYVGWGGKIRASFSSDKNFIAGLLNRAHLNYWYRMPGLNAIGMEIIVPMRTIICIFRENRQKELLVIKRIHIMYSGIIGLQDSLWREESSFLRMILQWLEKADNVVVAAPDFMFACKEMKGDNMINDCAEEVQINLYAKEHQDYICLK